MLNYHRLETNLYLEVIATMMQPMKRTQCFNNMFIGGG